MSKVKSHLAGEAAILAGGESRRMGRDKAWLTLGNKSFIEIQQSVVEPLFEPVRIIANRPERYRSLGLPVQTDLRPGSGPLGGIHAALSTAGKDIVVVTACDFPFLSSALLESFFRMLGDHDAVVPCNRGLPVPVCAVYSSRCLSAVEGCLEEGSLKATSFFERLFVRWVKNGELSALDPQGLALMNINTPEDYVRAKELFAKKT